MKETILIKRREIDLGKEHSSSLPIYFMSLFVIPHKVCLRLEKIQRDLWRRGELQSMPHLVNWFIVCMEKKDKGLGFRNLYLLNKALLGKLCWRSATENKPFWK